MQDLAATNMQLCYIEDLFYVVMCSIPNALIYCCSEMPNFIRLSAHSALDLHNQARASCEIHRATYNSNMRLNQQFDVIWTATNKVIHHRVASLSEQCLVMEHKPCIEAGFLTVCSFMSVVTKISCSRAV